MTDDNIVSRAEFQDKLNILYSERSTSNRSLWNKKQEGTVITFLQEVEECSIQKSFSHYHYAKTYGLAKIGNEVRVILKRRDVSEPLIFMVAAEDLYDKLLEAHIQTGHGGRDKMLYYAKNIWKVPKTACQLFTTCCKTCNGIQVAPKKGVIVKPIISDGFNMRGQVDLIDFQSTHDGEYSWLMNYQDHATKFLHLQPLKSKHAVNVAEELYKFLFTWGAPRILQSENGRKFVAAVIHESKMKM